MSKDDAPTARDGVGCLKGTDVPRGTLGAKLTDDVVGKIRMVKPASLPGEPDFNRRSDGKLVNQSLAT
jgi:hypothetical protein